MLFKQSECCGLTARDEEDTQMTIEKQRDGQQRPLLKLANHPTVQWEQSFAQCDSENEQREGQMIGVTDLGEIDAMQQGGGECESDAADDEKALSDFLTAIFTKHAQHKGQTGEPPPGGEHDEIRCGISRVCGHRKQEHPSEGSAGGIATRHENQNDERERSKKSHGHGIERIDTEKMQP